ncbi:MAG: hypothetical protein J0I13_06165 [Rhizobiales bacterium]|nr:hypothetical protein [Hyphomicrobiales bacterium]
MIWLLRVVEPCSVRGSADAGTAAVTASHARIARIARSAVEIRMADRRLMSLLA